jgi:hypothetical protein
MEDFFQTFAVREQLALTRLAERGGGLDLPANTRANQSHQETKNIETYWNFIYPGLEDFRLLDQ